MPFVMKVLAPFTTYSPSLRAAVAEIPARSEPVPGSVIAIAAISSPFTSPGSQRCFCSSVA